MPFFIRRNYTVVSENDGQKLFNKWHIFILMAFNVVDKINLMFRISINFFIKKTKQLMLITVICLIFLNCKTTIAVSTYSRVCFFN